MHKISEETLIRQAAPTLAGIKTGSLFPVSFTDREALLCAVRHLNVCLKKKGLRIIPVKIRQENALLYLYRPTRLQADLNNGVANRLLEQRGYPCSSANRCIARLICRLRESAEFPHEIGLFLGYPPEDVEGFIENRACGYKCVGCWKVYGDAAAAEEKFAQYKKCTCAYYKLWQKGKSIRQLAVAG